MQAAGQPGGGGAAAECGAADVPHRTAASACPHPPLPLSTLLSGAPVQGALLGCVHCCHARSTLHIRTSISVTDLSKSRASANAPLQLANTRMELFSRRFTAAKGQPSKNQ